jgi:hypothetical protein
MLASSSLNSFVSSLPPVFGLQDTKGAPSLSSLSESVSRFDASELLLECLLPQVKKPVSPLSKSPKTKNSKENKKSNEPQAKDQELETIPLQEQPEILIAQQECQALQGGGNHVRVLEDEDVKEEVVEIMGNDALISLSTRNIYRYLVFFVRNMNRYFEFEVEILDHQKKYRRIKATNARSLARIEQDYCQVPLCFGKEEGWRYMCLDLHEITTKAFGTKHVVSLQVRISGSCRLLRVFFQDELYSDAELPPHLTFLG